MLPLLLLLVPRYGIALRSSFFFFSNYRNDCYDNSHLVIILVGAAEVIGLLNNNDVD